MQRAAADAANARALDLIGQNIGLVADNIGQLAQNIGRLSNAAENYLAHIGLN